MKILVLFGSKSDERIYQPLVEKLGESDFNVNFKILSAHRNANELDEVLKTLDYQFIVAGAGLAAHLPGYCAAKSPAPVIGLPVAAMMGGFDSVMSIIQMPAGVPVLCSPPDQNGEIVNFLSVLRKQLQNHGDLKINLVASKEVLAQDHVVKELGKVEKVTADLNINFSNVTETEAGAYNIVLVNSARDFDLLDKRNEHIVMPIPMNSKPGEYDLDFIKTLFDWVKSGNGLWTGVNNIRNAIWMINRISKGLV